MPGLNLRLSRPGAGDLAEALGAANIADLTYGFVGATLAHEPVVAVRRRSIDLPRAGFEPALAGLREWVCHRGIGATVHPTRAPLEQGATMLVVLPVGPATILAPTRIVAVVDEADRFGFAYGTLPGHPEAGEESFVVARGADGAVTFTIAVAARPVPLLRPVSPLVALAQRRALSGYLRSMRHHVEAAA